MIKISHESPISMLEKSRIYNDYDYALVHLFETEPEYLSFFKESLKCGRNVLLDNSIFELGKAFDTKRYIYWLHELQPTEFIVPDVLEGCDATIASAENFIKEYNIANAGFYSWSEPNEYMLPKRIGVVQGKTYEELVKCYRYMDKTMDKIAISFDYSYYVEVFPHPNKWVAFMMGRVLTLTRLMNDGIINTNKPHHLLGCAHPREFSFYQGLQWSWIESLDTSSPIVHGIHCIQYNDSIGHWSKVSTKLVDLLHAEPGEAAAGVIAENIKMFRNFVK